jgi:hypothetical protein
MNDKSKFIKLILFLIGLITLFLSKVDIISQTLTFSLLLILIIISLITSLIFELKNSNKSIPLIIFYCFFLIIAIFILV